MTLTPMIASITNTTGIHLVDKVLDAYIYAFGGTLLLLVFVLGVFAYMAIKNDMDRTALTLGGVLVIFGLIKIMDMPDWIGTAIMVVIGIGVFYGFLRMADIA